MDNKEAICRIQTHMTMHRLYEPNAVFINEALNLAIKALHEQEPKAIKDAMCVDGHLMGKCPKCFMILTVQDHPKFCGTCGQEVKWND